MPTTVSYGTPGSPRKPFLDGKFDLVKSNGMPLPCPLATAGNANLNDGYLLMPDGNGKWAKATSGAHALRMVFTGNTIVSTIVGTDLSAYPGSEVTDAVSGLVGHIQAFYPTAMLTVGGGTGLTIANYTEGTALTASDEAGFEGLLMPAGEGDVVLGRVVHQDVDVTGIYVSLNLA